ncbi:MAG: exopolysaccharide biosynthesis polyprenyl glycosylphosphotransferase [Ruminococcus bromii]|nr:exopolysaccharide biosynthesis polyprenyl glycosylphosphotransferase [Ruminococcus bromii]
MNNKKFVLSMIVKAVILILEIGFFAMVLFQYYGPGLFSKLDSVGYAVTLILYTIVYIALGNLFRAFKIMDFSIAETVFSQFLAFGIADLLLYGEFCMIRHNYVNIIPGLLTVGCQLLTAICWALISKRTTMLFSKPEKTLIITGAAQTDEFLQKLEKLNHIFRVEQVIPYNELGVDWKKKLDPFEAVIFYETEMENRSELLWYCMQDRKSLYLTPQLDEITMQGFGARHLIDTPLMKYEYRSERFWYNLVKRAADIVVSLLALIIMSPILLITALAIKIEDRGPVFFRQKRCTKNGKVFEILKFRSMIVDAEKGGKSIPCRSGDPRITRVGRIIRKIRVDEFPQIINVLKGDMSLVGPRPERIEHVEEYTREIPEFVYRLRVKGGLTGYAQIYGKYNTSPYDKLRLDLQYIEKQSLLLDFKLLLLTVKIMFVPESTEGFTEEKSAALTESSKRVEEIEKNS